MSAVEVFRKIYKWLDVGDYLTARCTGRIVRTADNAFAAFLYDTRKGKESWNKGLLEVYRVKSAHMPEIIECTDGVGVYLDQTTVSDVESRYRSL